MRVFLSTLFALAVVAVGLAAAGADSWRDGRRFRL
jgi:hypothetical protein